MACAAIVYDIEISRFITIVYEDCGGADEIRWRRGQ
jgi:hypothetical protein